MAYGQTFHCLIIADTKIKDIGPGCEKDLADIPNRLDSIAHTLSWLDAIRQAESNNQVITGETLLRDAEQRLQHLLSTSQHENTYA